MTEDTQTTIVTDVQKDTVQFDRSILQQATAGMREHAITEATRLVVGYAETGAQTVASRFQDIAAVADSLLFYNLTGAVVSPKVSDAYPISASKMVDLRRDVLFDAIRRTEEWIVQTQEEKVENGTMLAAIMLNFILNGQPSLSSPQPSPSSTASPQPQGSAVVSASAQSSV